MTQHTPGPWYPGHIADDSIDCECRGIVCECYFGAVATVCVNNGIKRIEDGANDCPPLEEAKANARLIAAAPELLEALKELVDNYAHIISDERLAKCRAIIAKAEGRA